MYTGRAATSFGPVGGSATLLSARSSLDAASLLLATTEGGKLQVGASDLKVASALTEGIVTGEGGQQLDTRGVAVDAYAGGHVVAMLAPAGAAEFIRLGTYVAGAESPASVFEQVHPAGATEHIEALAMAVNADPDPLAGTTAVYGILTYVSTSLPPAMFLGGQCGAQGTPEKVFALPFCVGCGGGTPRVFGAPVLLGYSRERAAASLQLVRQVGKTQATFVVGFGGTADGSGSDAVRVVALDLVTAVPTSPTPSATLTAGPVFDVGGASDVGELDVAVSADNTRLAVVYRTGCDAPVLSMRTFALDLVAPSLTPAESRTLASFAEPFAPRLPQVALQDYTGEGSRNEWVVVWQQGREVQMSRFAAGENGPAVETAVVYEGEVPLRAGLDMARGPGAHGLSVATQGAGASPEALVIPMCR